ncbi:MAG: hypothetical protein ABIJ09_14885 [Pseudomonadota bacterium]
MTRVMGALVVVVGLALLALGVLFLIAAQGHTSRYLVALGGLAAGALGLSLGVRWFKLGASRTPEALRAELLRLAEQHSGEISEADAMAALGSRWTLAGPVLQQLTEQGLCRRERKAATTYFVFPGLLARLAVRRCVHCDAELPLDDTLATCPRCGGRIEIGVQALALSRGEFYGMDK